MAIHVSDGDAIQFIEGRSQGNSTELSQTTEGLCLVAGAIAERNLRDALARHGIHTPRFMSISTIEDTAQAILSKTTETSPRILNRQLTLKLLDDIIDEARQGSGPQSLRSLVREVHFSDDLRETFLNELDSYYRASNAEANHDTLYNVAETIDDAFVSERSTRVLEAFEAATAELENKLDDQDGVFLSRSHLVRAATESLTDHWTSAYPDVDWIVVKTVNVFDNPTLRLFEELEQIDGGPDIFLFFDQGTHAPLKSRFENTDADVATGPDCPYSRPDFIDPLLSTAESDPPADADQLLSSRDLTFIEAPEPRREVEQVLRHVDRLRTRDDTSLSDILVVAKDAGSYRAAFEDICTTHEFPYHVETRHPTAQTVPYRYLKAVVDLIAAASNGGGGEALNYWELINPIRLGFCPPDKRSTTWPMDDGAFLRLEEHLHQSQRQNTVRGDIEYGKRTFEEWFSVVSQRDGMAWDQLESFLNWIVEVQSAGPPDAGELETLLHDLLRSQAFHTATTPVRSSKGPAVDPTRPDINKKHQTSILRRVEGSLESVRTYFDISTEIDDFREPSWNLAAEALGESLGNQSFGLRNADGNALRIVDAANAYFLEASHVFVIGATSGDFPADPSPPTFFHQALYERVWEMSVNPADAPAHLDEEVLPYLYFPSRDFQFRQELDAYEAGISASTDSLAVVRHYRDTEGDTVAWSPFVDSLPFEDNEDAVEHIQLGQWVPGSSWYGDWASTTTRSPMRDRLRLALFHLRDELDQNEYTPRLTSESLDDEANLIRLLASVDGAAFQEYVAPGYERFSDPITTVTVEETEDAFDRGPALAEVVGEPFRPHEIDLYAKCPLKYYFSQFLFGVSGQDVDRDLPEVAQQDQMRSYDRVPNIIRQHYATNQHRTAVGKLITDYLENRQADLDSYRSVAELKDDFDTWADNDSDIEYSAFQPLVGEYLAVQEETAEGINREWDWNDNPDSVTIRGHEVQLPPHRLDSFGETEEKLAVFQTGNPGGGRVALKQCFAPEDDGVSRPTAHHQICNSCSNQEECTYNTKFVHDHRARTAGVAGISSGTLLIDPLRSASYGRYGEVSESLDDILEPIEQEEYVESTDVAWSHVRSEWRGQTGESLIGMTPDGGQIEYEQTTEFVRNGGCEGCAFRDLCQLPDRIDEEQDGGENQ